MMQQRTSNDLMNELVSRDGLEFRDHHLSFYGSYLYLNSPDRSHLIYQELIKDYKFALKQKDHEILMLRNELDMVMFCFVMLSL